MNRVMAKAKLLYISPRDVLKARSDPIHVMASCKWFRRSGLEVELLAPRYHRGENIPEDDLFGNYGIGEEDRFTITHLPTGLRDDSRANRIRLRKLVHFSLDALKRFLIRREFRHYTKYVVFSKCYLSFLPLYYLARILRAKNVVFVFEAAAFQNRRSEIRILRKFAWIVAINTFLKEDIVREAGISRELIVVPAHGLDDVFAEKFQVEKKDARGALGLPEIGFIAVYSGKIYVGEESEVALILRAAARLPSVRFIFTGGKPGAIAYFESLARKLGANNVSFVGFFPSAGDTFPYLRAADALISFYPKCIPTLRYMVPGKIVQYARARTVIVSARYPAIEEMIGPDGAVYVDPEDVDALAAAIERVRTGKVDARRIADNAYGKIMMNSYKRRTRDILSIILE